MKKILFTLLALALLPVFVFAQDCPTPPASVTATVTFQRRSAGPVFSVSSTTKVQFSQGNLQYQASTNTWRFAEHQYDMIGADNSNISSSYTGWIDLFGWGTGNNPTITSNQDNDYNTFTDWGQNMSPADYWRTLSSTEWTYLLNTRTTTTTIESVPNARFMRAMILTDGSGVWGKNYNINGVILFPDNYSGDKPDGVTWSAACVNKYLYNFSADICTCTTAGWAALEAAGCVFLPCADYRDGTTVTFINQQMFYWTSTASSGAEANSLYFPDVSPIQNKARHLGHSVRLVHVVE